jgi:malonate-semialdehyde dehydrogenase (acetylating)/methylmalonate-semialdehyde dehydrogenase
MAATTSTRTLALALTSYNQDGEGPIRSMKVAAFQMDRRAVTNAQFAEFVGATHYKTERYWGQDKNRYSGGTPMSSADHAWTSSVVGSAALRNYVDGAWVTPESRERLEVTNPATGAVLAMVPLSNATDIDCAVQRAHAAFPAWRRTPPMERARVMFAVKTRLEEHFEELASIVTREHGKTLDDARGSVRRAIENVEVAAGIPSLMMGYGLEDGAARNIDEEVIRQPLGVFAAVCPFNFPLMVPFWFWPYAIATGNTFILKPSEQVLMAMTRVFELIEAWS